MYFETYTESKITADREQQMKKHGREKKMLFFLRVILNGKI
jgi:hypothetical protein